MKKRSIALIIGLMSFALLGVITMQLYFLRQSYQLQSELFDRSVNEALNNVVARISRHDALNFLNAKTRVRQQKQVTVWNSKAVADNGSPDASLPANTPKHKLTAREKKI